MADMFSSAQIENAKDQFKDFLANWFDSSPITFAIVTSTVGSGTCALGLLGLVFGVDLLFF